MHRSHQRRRSSIPGPDTIDRLDNGVFGGYYHHEGPYDPTLLARQNGPAPPVEALRESNAAAIAATPRANILDCLEKHRPLQGTAMVAPGMKLPGGELIGGYEEYDMMRQGGGNYRRYPQFEYLDEDLKGKGEPSYTQDLLERQEKAARRKRSRSEGNGGWPTSDGVARVRSNSASFLPLAGSPAFPAESNLGRSKSSASRTSPGKRSSLASRLKKHFSWGSKKD